MFHNISLRSLSILLFFLIALIFGASAKRTVPAQVLPAHTTSAHTFPAKTSKATNISWLSVAGRDLKDPSGNTVILRGVSLVDLAVANSRTRNVNALIDMATDHANGWYAYVVRLPVYPDAIDGQPGWKANPEVYFTKYLDPAIQHCISKQIYCIIDWHYVKDYTSSEVDKATRAFWTYVAPKYADIPNVIFELYNEPIYPDQWNTWKTTAQPWVDMIRVAAPKNLILIGGPRWSQNVAQAATNPFTGSNLVYVAHIYPGHGAQSVWDSWFGNSSNTVPYFITEWGWQGGGNIPTNGTKSGYGVPFSAYLDSKGVSWTAWVFDSYWQPIMFDAKWNLLGGEKYMGEFTKDFLYKHRNNNLPDGVASSNAVDPAVGQAANSIATPRTITNIPASKGTLKVQLVTGGTDNSQQSAFHYRVVNTGSGAQSNISIRIYFTTDGSQAASSYILEKYYDQSGSATISGPALQSGSTYYFTIDYGPTTLPTGTSWEYQTALRLNNWSSNYRGANDWWHTIATLPANYIDWINLPAYVSGSLVWGIEAKR